MHGQPRKPLEPEDAATIQKAANLRALQTQLLHNHHNKIYNEEAVDLSTRLVETNPEFYTAWNYRKLAFEHNIISAVDQDAVRLILNEELRVVENALRRNVKSYGAWHHRKWVLAKGLSSTYHEFRLLDGFQKLDSRNFHAWNYRRFVAALQNVSEEVELKHTTEMIDTNFSNYSAWHNRSAILSHLLKQGVHGFDSKEKALAEEYEVVHQAIFTDPDDQSDIKFTFVKNEDVIWKPLSTKNLGYADAWVTYLKFPDEKNSSSDTYQVEVSVGHSQGIISSSGSNYSFPSQFSFTTRLGIGKRDGEGGVGVEKVVWTDNNFHTDLPFLEELSHMLSSNRIRVITDQNPTASTWQIETIVKEIALFRELLLEVNCKIGKLTLVRLLVAHDAMMSYHASFAYKKVNTEEILELLSDLMKLDPSHSRYYKDGHSLALLEKVFLSRKSLMKHCLYYGESTSSYSHDRVCLRLNNMSLSRIGSFENLLWVRMLDLSHNELQTTEGLEALQLLSCLNLSYNKFRSFTALEPLRLLQSLSVLDISYNEIGLHPIDTTSYLCASPLSHKSNIEGIGMSDCWEAEVVFKGLQLKQLDVAGCAINGDKLRSLLVKVLPNLKWLDGEVVN
ncbi:geranylgeranyl transferase type-2 subunit alpha 1-like isoform X2 [Papaver somniferum]|uniref:geranylgeranyl transferase type-2 subunit alpha 1-like isoform X2 n=1 Tax=Papaver somniferum TaxID=3469 RepID=UPI000E700780|nr:geranylgeranyl transferase type-2 subunit alpha 1-like isoform X2 [Papaver somniferum]